MNLSRIDTRVMVLAAVFLIIAVLAWLYLRNRRTATAGLRQKFGPEYESGGAEAWVRAKSRSEISGSREAG